ncbi:MAG: hypothetical protein ACE5HK_04455 [Candidatus Methylomirabilales bacterium]
MAYQRRRTSWLELLGVGSAAFAGGLALGLLVPHLPRLVEFFSRDRTPDELVLGGESTALSGAQFVEIREALRPHRVPEKRGAPPWEQRTPRETDSGSDT